jgi:hypothetical protein
MFDKKFSMKQWIMTISLNFNNSTRTYKAMRMKALRVSFQS